MTRTSDFENRLLDEQKAASGFVVELSTNFFYNGSIIECGLANYSVRIHEMCS